VRGDLGAEWDRHRRSESWNLVAKQVSSGAYRERRTLVRGDSRGNHQFNTEPEGSKREKKENIDGSGKVVSPQVNGNPRWVDSRR